MPTRLAFLLTLVLALLLPAAAYADTYTVDPADGNNSCTGSDRTCRTIGQAVAAAGAGDTISVLKGTYPEFVEIPAGKEALRIIGAGPGDVKITGSGTGDVLTIAAKDVRLSGVTVEVPGGGARAVLVGETGTTLASVVLQRGPGAGADTATVEVVDTGSLLLTGGFVVQAAGAAGTPAIRSTGVGLRIEDTVALAATGPAVVIESSGSNRIIRSTLASTEASSDALRIHSDDPGGRGLVLDSSILLGGQNAAGLTARSTSSDAADIAIEARHVTIAGAARGIQLDATTANGPALPSPAAAGNIDAKVFSSIVHGPSVANRHSPAIPGITSTANTAKLTFSNSDAPPPAPGSGTVEMGGATFTEDSALFAPKSLKLRADAPVIDRGGELRGDESRTDIDGEPREADGPDADGVAQSDIGADEYVNQPPVARFGVTDTKPRQGQAVGFISGSTDPEQGAGGGIVEYRWDFGDGTRQTTTVGGVAHTYNEIGTYKATLQVVDNQGLVSAVTPPQTVTVTDGTPPRIAVTAPTHGARVNLNPPPRPGSRRKPRPLQLTILGTAADASGIDSVEVALAMTKRDPKRRTRRTRRARRSQTRTPQCQFYTGRVFARRKACDKPTWVRARTVPGGWTLRTRRGLRLPAGRYEIRARAKDATGLLSSVFSTKERTIVRFRVR